MFLGMLVYWYLFKPTIVLQLNTTNFNCSEVDKYVVFILDLWADLSFPISYQAVFFGLIWQMSRIQEKKPLYDTEATSVEPVCKAVSDSNYEVTS